MLVICGGVVMKKLTQEQLDEVLRLHKLWVDVVPGGVRANLSGLDFTGANLTGADLTGVDFTGANLTDADFEGAILWDCTGDGKRIRTTKTDRYIVNHYDDRVQIGCKNYSLSEWAAFSDDEIARMDTGALAWWKEWREFVLTEGKVEECK